MLVFKSRFITYLLFIIIMSLYACIYACFQCKLFAQNRSDAKHDTLVLRRPIIIIFCWLCTHTRVDSNK